MSRDHEKLAVLRKQLAITEEVVIGLHQKLWDANRRNYYLYADGAIAMMLKLRAEIDEVLGIDKWSPDGEVPANGTPAEKPVVEPVKT